MRDQATPRHFACKSQCTIVHTCHFHRSNNSEDLSIVLERPVSPLSPLWVSSCHSDLLPGVEGGQAGSPKHDGFPPPYALSISKSSRIIGGGDTRATSTSRDSCSRAAPINNVTMETVSMLLLYGSGGK